MGTTGRSRHGAGACADCVFREARLVFECQLVVISSDGYATAGLADVALYPDTTSVQTGSTIKFNT